MSRQCRSKVELIQLGSAHDKYGVWTKPYASIQQGEKQKRCHPKSDFRLWQAAYFSTKNSINNVTQKFLESSCISFCTSSAKRQSKTSRVDTKLCQFQLSKKTSSKMLHKFSAWTHLSNFDQSEHKIGLGAWPTRNYGEKSEKHLSSPPVFLNNRLNFRVQGQFEIKMLIVLGHSDINATYFIWV